MSVPRGDVGRSRPPTGRATQAGPATAGASPKGSTGESQSGPARRTQIEDSVSTTQRGPSVRPINRAYPQPHVISYDEILAECKLREETKRAIAQSTEPDLNMNNDRIRLKTSTGTNKVVLPKISAAQLAANRAMPKYERPGMKGKSPFSEVQKKMVLEFVEIIGEQEPNKNSVMKTVARQTGLPEQLIRHYVKATERKKAVDETLVS